MPYYSKTRTLAYAPRLDLAIRAGDIYRYRGGGNIERPVVLTERAHDDIVVSKTERESVSTGSFAWQTATQTFPNREGREGREQQ